MYVFICENSIDGVFTGVYDAWDSHYGHKNIQLEIKDTLDNYSLFYHYIEVTTDIEKSKKVANTLLSKLGEEVYYDICQAISAFESTSDRKKEMGKADAVYKTIVLGLSLNDGSKILNYLGEPCINRVFQLCRSTANEAHHMTGFLRFSELENGILFSKIHPKHHILPILADHFADRLPEENFIIYDENRKSAAIHKFQMGYLLADVPAADEAFMTNYSEDEKQYRELWCEFFNSIAIEARKNVRLQKQNIPKRFWSDTIELNHT